EPDVGPTQEPILAEVSTQEPIMAEVSSQEPIMAEVNTEAPIVEEVGTHEFSVEDVVIEEYVSSREDGENAEHGNGQEDESAPTDGQFFYDDEGIDTGQKFTSPKKAKDRVYLHSIESRRNLKLYKNDSVRIRARYEGKVPVFTMSQGTGPTGPYSGMEVGPSGSSGPTTKNKKGRI
nr:shikimate O-hydroxycinnamoyltransferase [Tanacetum cinerariifolium]